MKIGFIGLGRLGMPCAEVMAEKHIVNGFDLVCKQSVSVNIKNTLEHTIRGTEIIFIAVPTPHEPLYGGETPISNLPPKDFNYECVNTILIEIEKYVTPDQMVVLISTVLPSTTRRLAQNLNFKLIYNPYLIAMGSVAWDMVNPEMVIIGTETGNPPQKLIDFYETIITPKTRYEIGTWEEAECIKIFYNTFMSAKLSLVNMIQDVAVKNGNINVDVVTKALENSNKRITGPQYMTAGMGDGGACHPRDNIALRHLAESLDLGYDIFSTIMISREVQAENLAKELVKYSQEKNLPIVIHGKAYKPNVPYTEGSYSLLIGHFCKKMKQDVFYVDPLTNDTIDDSKPAVFLLAHDRKITYRYTNQLLENELYCDIQPGSVVIDPWRKYHNENVTVIHYGNTRNL